MKPDEELKKAYRMYIDKDGFIVAEFLFLWDDLKERDRTAELMKAEGDALFMKEKDKRLNVLVDISQIKKLKPLPAKSQQIFIEMMSLQKVNKVAFIVLNPFFKALAYLATKMSGKLPRVGFFDSKAKAVVWLKENK